ncbi:MAG: hypothetical protein AB7W16_17100, partial [Candidatus Obscuribacterales bacterium]
FWQSYYLAVVIVRGGKLIPWLDGTFRALLMLPLMLRKRRDINARRQVDHSYMERIIIESENELREAKRRLNLQSLEKARQGTAARTEAKEEMRR